MIFSCFKKLVNAKTHTWNRINDDAWAKTMFPTFQDGDEFWECNYNAGPLARAGTFYHIRNDEMVGEEDGDLIS